MFEDFRIRIFMEVASEGSFTKAAKNIGISQPAVSQNISELEKTLGVTLFERMRGEVALTDAGKTFKAYADNIMHWYHAAGEIFSSTAGKHSAPITIGCSPLIASSIIPGIVSLMRSGGNYSFEVRSSALGDEDVILKMEPGTQTLNFDAKSAVVSIIQPVIVLSSRTKESLDKKRKYSDSLPYAIYSTYETLLPLDIQSRVVFKSDSIDAILDVVSQSNSLIAIVPNIPGLTTALETLPLTMPGLQLELVVKYKDQFSLTSAGRIFKETLNNLFK